MTISSVTSIPLALIGGSVAQDVLTQGEYESCKAALPSWRDRLIAMLLRNTGIRVNEPLNLEVRYCVLDGPAFIIYTQRSKKRASTRIEADYATYDAVLSWATRNAQMASYSAFAPGPAKRARMKPWIIFLASR